MNTLFLISLICLSGNVRQHPLEDVRHNIAPAKIVELSNDLSKAYYLITEYEIVCRVTYSTNNIDTATNRLSDELLIINLNNPLIPESCNELWEEQGLKMFVTSIDSAESCSFNASGEFWLYPAKLIIDLNDLLNNDLLRIEVDIEDYCGINCTSLSISDESDNTILMVSNQNVSNAETLVIQSLESIKQQKRIVIQSFEAQIKAIRLYF
jgi:hypothetical protein